MMESLIDAHEFAITVVSANSQNGTLQEIAEKSLELYKRSYDVAVNHNKPIEQKRSDEIRKNQDAFLDAFS